VCADDLRTRVKYLASDALAGRMSTEPGGQMASEYVAAEFARFGLKPMGDEGGWFQGFEIPHLHLDPGNALELETVEVGAMGDVAEGGRRTFAIEKDWNPFSISRVGEASGPLAFAGFGVCAPEKDYDDWKGLEVEGRVVLVLRKEPFGGKRPTAHAAFLSKLAEAAKRKAAALIVVNDAASAADGGDRMFHWSVPMGPAPGSAEVPFAFVTRKTADAMLAPLGKDVVALEEAIRKGAGEGKPRPVSCAVPGAKVRIAVALGRAAGKNARNVIGLLEGSDEKMRDEVVVLGAHHDHVGLGWFASAGGSAAAGKIHPGADDNASGTAALLEIAEELTAAGKTRPKRSVLFLSFSGEELGLLGSAYYVEHPVVALDHVVTMVNCDMVGRYDAQKSLEIGGVGTGAGLQELVTKANAPYGLTLTWDPQGTAPSDSTSFFVKDVPVLFFFTGLHAQYHTPADTWPTLDYADGEKVAALCRDTLLALAAAEKRPAFTKPPPRPGANRAILGISRGAPGDAPGVVVGEVAKDGPAAKAGITAGDVILAIDAAPTKTAEELLRALAPHAPGDSVKVQIRRGDETKVLTVVLGSL
jgi:Zn-dependent M28 family amino/carboxypeptidase